MIIGNHETKSRVGAANGATSAGNEAEPQL